MTRRLYSGDEEDLAASGDGDEGNAEDDEDDGGRD